MSSTNPNHHHHPHIALLTFPFASHPGNLFTLAQMLAASAPTATFSFLTSHQSFATLSSTPHPDNIRLYEIEDGCGPHTPPSMPPVERIGQFIKATPGNFKAGMDKAVKEEGGVKFSCLVTDAFLAMMGREVAEEMDVPWLPIWTGGPPGLLSHLFTDELRRRIGVHENVDEGIKHQADKQLAAIPVLSAFRITDLPEGIVLGDIHAPFPTLLHQMATNLPHATAVAVNSFQGLQPDVEAHFSSSFKQLLLIGPFNLIHQQYPSPQNNNECVAWLDRQSPASVAYISFGTVLVPPPAQLEELAHGLEASGAPFLWALKDKSIGELAAGFLDRTNGRGLVVSWAPQIEVLGHKAVGAFLTHCGWNSILESITSGVPIICKPFFGDQRANARTVECVWKIGVTLKEDRGRLYRGDVARAVTVVLKEGDEIRGRTRELKQLGIQAAESGGSSAENFRRLLEIVCGRPNV